MGTFCTTTSLETIMYDTSFNTATTALASECITNAENKIREKLSKRYDVASAAFQTSTSTPPVVQTICKWLSVGYMYEDLSRGGKDGYSRADRYIKKAMGNLDEILNYKANIVDSSGDLITESTESIPIYSNTNDYHETFNEDSPLNWSIDPDKVEDIDNERS